MAHVQDRLDQRQARLLPPKEALHESEAQAMLGHLESQKDSDTGNRTPSYRVKGDNVSRYTISDDNISFRWSLLIYAATPPRLHDNRIVSLDANLITRYVCFHIQA